MNLNPAYPVAGVEVVTVVIDVNDNTIKHVLNINFPQFVNSAKYFTNENNYLQVEIVKRRNPSPKGHLFWARHGKARDVVYHTDFNYQVRKLARMGATDTHIADFFEITDMMYKFWLSSHPGFASAYRQGKQEHGADYVLQPSTYEERYNEHKPNSKNVE